MMSKVVVFVLILSFTVLQGSYSEKIPLYFSFITSINPRTGFPSAGGIPSVDMALELINNRNDILPNYTLQYTEILDSKCDRTAALDSFFNHFTKDDNYTYIATACCGCSVATIPVAEISHYWNIPQMSFSAALALNDRSRFRNFFRIITTNKNLAFGIVRTVAEFGWRKMLVITQDEELFTSLQYVLQLLFNVEGWIIDTTLVINSNTNPFPADLIFNKIDEEQYKIILINTYSQFAYKILCQAFRRKMIAPQFIWMTHLWYNKQWWRFFQNEDNPCTSHDIHRALIGSIGVIPDGFVLAEHHSSPTSSGLNATHFLEEYNRRIKEFRINNASVPPISLPNVGFDLAWSLAVGLDNAVERVAEGNDTGCEDIPGDIVALEDFDYSNQKMGCILRESIGSAQFEGLSGPIKFNENGSQPENRLLVQQYQILSSNAESEYVERTTVARIDIAVGSITFTNSNVLWEELPYDGYPELRIDQYHIALFTIYNILIIAGLIFSIVCLIFNILFRKKRVLKLSSPNLNYFIIFGSVILYLSVFVFIYMPSRVGNFVSATVICNLRIWLFSLGYTICFAVILSKTWRVYYIFNNPSPKKKVIKDWMLILMIAVIVLIELCILVIGTSIEDLRLEADEITSIENPTTWEDGKLKKNFIYVCLRDRSGPIIWLSISYAYKGILQIIGIFMAFHIRKVKIKALNDSKETAAVIYINTIILITLIASAFALDDYHNGHAAIFGLAIFIDATLFLGALFVPKMITLYNDPTEKKVWLDQNLPVSQNTLRTWQAGNDEKLRCESNKILKLQEEINKLKNIVDSHPCTMKKSTDTTE